MKNFAFASTVLLAAATAAVACGSAGLSISTAAVAAASAANTAAQAASTPSTSIQNWTGVWKITTPGKPGGVLSIASDAGPNGTSLSGIIVFYVMNRETGQRIAIEPRTMVNPHVEGNALAFQVRRILKPHLQGDPPASQEPLDPTDVVNMTLTPTSEAKAILTCPKCGEAAPTELVKEQ